jgi:type II secretory pathway pseudopilin PulG
MRRPFPLRRGVRYEARHGERGTILLLLMLTVALMTIAAVALLPTISYEMHRDRETEMIHRGVQYSRAIRNYYKKFGRYPTKLEDLDNTNNLRYLRKHYKDPITGKDFKLLRYGDPDVKLSLSFGGGGIQGANTVGQMNGPASSSAFGSPGSSSFGSSPNSAFGGSAGFGNNSNSAFGNSNSAFGNSSSFGGNSNNGNSNGSSSSSDSSSNSDASSNPENTGPNTSQAQQQIAAGSAGGSSGGQVFGGGPIIGVASTSKEKGFHEYNHKSKYNEWQFVYDPTADRGGLITTPYQPNLPNFANLNGNSQNGQNGQPGTGTNSSPFGQSNGFSSGFGNGGTNGGFGNNNSGFGNNNSGFGNNNSGFGGGNQPQQPQQGQSPQ